jgi:hypothetical protein
MFEHRHAHLISRRKFLGRLARTIAAGLAFILLSLVVGMCGYHHFESRTWVQAFGDAAMILSGMGPLEPPATEAGMIFAGCYALYSGLALISSVGVMAAPVMHRFLHKFHLETEQEDRVQKRDRTPGDSDE